MASEQPQEKAVRIASSSSGLPEPIPVRLDAAAVQAALDQRDQRIQALEALLAKLRQAGGRGTASKLQYHGIKIDDRRLARTLLINGPLRN